MMSVLLNCAAVYLHVGAAEHTHVMSRAISYAPGPGPNTDICTYQHDQNVEARATAQCKRVHAIRMAMCVHRRTDTHCHMLRVQWMAEDARVMPMVDCQAPNWQRDLLDRTDELYVEEEERLRLLHEQIHDAHLDHFMPGPLKYLETCLVPWEVPGRKKSDTMQ